MTRTPPAHGERRCYLRGCRRPECSDAHYRYMSRYRLDRERGQQRRVDSAPTADHIRTLLDAGWNKRQIAAAARCSHRVVTDLAARRYPNVLPRIADGVLAIAPHSVPAPAQYADATGTIRRVRALTAMGYPIAHLSTAIGIWPANLGRIARGELTQVTVATAKATTAVYRELCRRPGPSQAARSRAEREGWHGPIAWGADIDDPAAEPEVESKEKVASGPIILQPCGTPAAYRRHLRRGEPIDGACRAANSRAAADRKHAKAQVAA